MSKPVNLNSLLQTALLCIACVIGANECMAQAARPAVQAWYEGFEGPQTSWVMIGGDAQFRIEAHNRVVDYDKSGRQVYTGDWSEYFRINCVSGNELFIVHDVQYPRVIDELLPSLRVKSDRPGIQLWAEVVLPRSTDKRTGQPLTTMIPGSTYNKVGSWERLTVENLVQELRHKTWSLRIEHGSQVDPGEAYVRRILLDVCTGEGRVHLWVDDLDISGHVCAFQQLRNPKTGIVEAGSVNGTGGNNMSSQNGSQARWSDELRDSTNTAAQRAAVHGVYGQNLDTGVDRYDSSTDDRTGQQPPSYAGGRPMPVDQPYRDPTSMEPVDNFQSIAMVGSKLIVEGHPMVPRIIEYRGEPISFLKQLGFNTIWLAGLPDARLLAEVQRERMWMVCPPPNLPSDNPDLNEAPIAPIGPEYDRVLGWCVGRRLDEAQLAGVLSRIEQIRRYDRRQGRLMICEANSGIRVYSRQADVMLFGRRPLLSSFELADYSDWLLGQQRLTRPGTPIWSTVQTQPLPSVTEQWRAMLPERLRTQEVPEQGVTIDQIRMLVRAAMAAGSRGLFFESDSPLDGADLSSKYRATALELVNMELAMLEPWISGGRVVCDVESSEEHISGLLVETERSRLLVPLFTEPGGQYVLGKSAGESISFVVPGIPEDYEAYLLVPGALRPLRTSRQAGGVSVTIDQFTPASLVVLSQDPMTINQLMQRTRLIGERAARLRCELTSLQLQSVSGTHNRLQGTELLSFGSIYQTHMTIADQRLSDARRMLDSDDPSNAYIQAERAAEPLRIIQRAYWEEVNRLTESPQCAAGFVCFDSLPWLERFMRHLTPDRFGENLIGGGACEDVGKWLQAGWNMLPITDQAVQGEANLAFEAAKTGRFGLRLTAVPTSESSDVMWLRSPPVTITSPSVPVEGGSLVCIDGWVHVPGPITGSVEGLKIIDSIGGPALAQRIGQTSQWQRFTMYRYVPIDQRLVVTFELSGLGEAWLDDISIRPVREGPPIARPLNTEPLNTGPTVTPGNLTSGNTSRVPAQRYPSQPNIAAETSRYPGAYRAPASGSRYDMPSPTPAPSYSRYDSSVSPPASPSPSYPRYSPGYRGNDNQNSARRMWNLQGL